ncbi:hypothetical protein ACFLU6_08370 [Acidobacteriota bacterium]
MKAEGKNLITFAVLIMALAAIGSASLWAQKTEDWAVHYNGTGDDSDFNTVMAVDSSGNVYVTGVSEGMPNQDATTVAYDPSGNEIWTARHSAPGGSSQGQALVIDGSGNVFVAASSAGVGTHLDYATIAYDSSGNEIWQERYSGPANGPDFPGTIALDADGNVYITGSSEQATSDYDAVTIAYDSSGNQLWMALYDGPGSPGSQIDEDGLGWMVLDDSGNIYLSGYCTGDGTRADILTIAYDSSGNELWVATYDGPASSDDRGRGIAMGPDGNLYVVGLSYDPESDWDYVTISYDTSGNQRWVARYDGPASSQDYVRDIGVSPSGRVIVTGSSRNADSDFDWATIAYDAYGNVRWTESYAGALGYDDYANALAFDTWGRIYITGTLGIASMGKADVLTVAYSPSGNELWTAIYNGPGNDYDRSTSIALDASGNIYVSGESDRLPDNRDYLTLKYAADPDPVVPACALEPVLKGKGDDPEKYHKGWYTVRYDVLNNPGDLVAEAYVNAYGGEGSCEDDPGFLGYPVEDGNIVKLHCKENTRCNYHDRTGKDKGNAASVQIQGPGLMLYVKVTDSNNATWETECIIRCEDAMD